MAARQGTYTGTRVTGLSDNGRDILAFFPCCADTPEQPVALFPVREGPLPYCWRRECGCGQIWSVRITPGISVVGRDITSYDTDWVKVR